MADVPDTLYHYYARARGPLVNLSALDPDEAERVLDAIRRAGAGFASRRAPDYLAVRRELEGRVRALFVARGGRPRTAHPHYFTLGRCDWLLEWYAEGCALAVPLAAFDPVTVSFTYGDSFPALRVRDGRPYRGHVYTLAELPELLGRYGLPQEWNPDGAGGPERYVEAQVWDDAPLAAYLARPG